MNKDKNSHSRGAYILKQRQSINNFTKKIRFKWERLSAIQFLCYFSNYSHAYHFILFMDSVDNKIRGEARRVSFSDIWGLNWEDLMEEGAQ